MDKKVFISHSQKDKIIADIICATLEAEDIGCWIAPRDIPYGNDWAGEITKAIEESSLFLFILSQHSNASRQCPKEISVADNVGVPIICIKTDDSEMKPGLKYHLSMQQMMVIDASKISDEMHTVLCSVKEKLIDQKRNPEQISKGTLGQDSYNIDKQLDAKFEELFGPKSDSPVNTAEAEISSVSRKLGDIAAKNFMMRLEDDVKQIEKRNSDKISTATVEFRKRILSPIDQTGKYLNGKHFRIPHIDGVKTLVFQILEDVVDFDTRSKYFDCVLLESVVETDLGYTTYFVDELSVNGTSLIFLHFYESGDKLFLNTGILYNNVVKVCKKPMLQTFQKISVKNNKIHLSNVGYNSDSFSLSDFSELHGSNDEVWHEADIRTAPIVVIDPDTAELVLREVYYDKSTNTTRARMKLTNNKSYFAFQIRHSDTDSPSIPLTDFEQGKYYRQGVYGFPKDPLKAAEFLEKAGTGEAIFEMAMLFAESSEFRDDETYRQFLTEAIAMNCENAIVEQTLAVYFEEISDTTLVDCINMLDTITNDESTASMYVLAHILETTNPDRAFELYLKSAKNDFPPAVSRLQCSDSTLNDQSDAVLRDVFLRSLNENKGVKEYCMGCACFFGYGMRIRKNVGIDLLLKAANLGDTDAQKTLFEIYDTDTHYGNKVQALHWLEKLAAYDTSARVDLANRYIDGIGCERSSESDTSAFEILRSLAESDNRTAINNLAWMYKVGRGCEQDYIKARVLFERSADLGCAAAFYHLGTMYEKELGVNKDLDTARKMYETAAEKGHKKAKEQLASLQ